jgi:hypothetical protein
MIGRGIATVGVWIAAAAIAYVTKDGCVPACAGVIASFFIWADT